MNKTGLLMLVLAAAALPVGLRARAATSPVKWVPLAEDGADADKAHFFTTHVKPVLEKSCFRCHGERGQRGGLRLDSREAMLKGGARGPAVVPGDPDKSFLNIAVGYHDNDLKMPPRRQLPDDQIADLRKWVQDGAVWPEPKTEEHADKAGE